MPWYVLVLVVVGVGSGMLTACDGPSPSPTSTACTDVPQLEWIQVAMAEPKIYRNEFGPLANPEEVYLAFGNPESEDTPSAIIVAGQASIPEPAGDGHLEFVQNVSAKIVVTYADGSEAGYDRSGDWFIDGNDPYINEKSPLCTPGASCTHVTSDLVSTSLMLGNPSGSPMVRVEREASFRTYLLWRPISGVRISLGFVEWYIHVFAQRDITNTSEHKWMVERYNTDPKHGMFKYGSSTSEMPVLSPRIQDVQPMMLKPPATPTPQS
jgi:hypothetical protein